jgi:type IX secretion system substrate protein
MKNRRYSVALWVCMLLFAPATMNAAGTVLAAGDIAVLGWNSRGDTGPGQRWAFITFVNISSGTTIFFTDYGYDATLTNFKVSATNDGHMSWTTSSFIAKGTVIYGTNNSVNGAVSGVGGSGVTGQLGGTSGYFNTAGDQIIVYQGPTLGSATGATFIYALNTGQSNLYTGGNGTWYTGGVGITNDNISCIPPGLTSTTAVALTSGTTGISVGTGSAGSANYGFDNMRYAGITSGTKTQILTAMASSTNWLGNNDALSPYDFTSGGVYPTNAFTVLPVTLLNYSARLQANETVQLSWATAAEINNDHFTIERSADGIQFSVIGTVAANGNNEPARYSFTDQLPEAGYNFYRLSQTDIDGREKILGIRTVTVQNARLRVFPNPATDAINVRFNAGTWQEIILFNAAGQLLRVFQLTARDSRLRIPLTPYQPGSYFLAFVARNGQVQTVKRFVLAK